jgi:hypothetical protein
MKIKRRLSAYVKPFSGWYSRGFTNKMADICGKCVVTCSHKLNVPTRLYLLMARYAL